MTNTSEKDLPWTGERYVPQVRGDVAIEHLHRYAFACELSAGKRVLDIACGEGYGSEMLSRDAESVVGVDIDPASVAHAKAKYGSPKLKFLEGTCEKIPLPNESVDLVVSFETIEHIVDHGRFLSEVGRVLSAKGVLVISTPEKSIYSDLSGHTNPFHKKELYRAEFSELLASFFPEIVTFEQKIAFGSYLVASVGKTQGFLTVQLANLSASARGERGLGGAVYLVAVCSRVALPPLSNSLCEQKIWESETYVRNLQSASFPWRSYLYKMLDIRKLFRPIKEKQSGVATKRIGFWRRLERSIRKRRKRWIGGIGFDREWYLKEYPDVAHASFDPVDHYCRYGIMEGRWKSKKDKLRRPNPQKSGGSRGHLFGRFREKIRKLTWLLRDYPLLFAQLQNRLQELEKTFPFDPWWYRAKYPDVESSGMSPFQHFIAHGSKKGRLPNRRFQPECYLAVALEAANYGIPASLHYLLRGWKEGRCANRLDRYVENCFGQSTRERVSNLMNQLLQEENPADPEASRKQKIKKLECRLVEALRNRPSMTEKPKVSIIVPVYNQVAHTLACAISLYESDPASTFELIIADDCSTDETKEIFGRLLPDVHVVRTRRNLGFLRNCNYGAKMARGEFLVFLNNDMLVLPGWLDSMIETFKLHPRCGIVGSKILNYDGTLQEAGGIFWNDGSAYNYGRGSDPELPEFNYCRPVDYCSGASICIRKRDWEELRGFDEMYERAYCEDADISFRMRKTKGLETIYQPFSVGIHLEGVSSGTDTTQGEKAYQVTNLKKFFLRWRENLIGEHEENGQNLFQARGRSMKKKTILVADHYITQYDQDAGSRSTYQIIDCLIKNGCNVIFWPHNLHYDRTYGPYLQKKGVYVIYDGVKKLEFALWLKDHAEYIDSYFLNRPNVAHDLLPQIKYASKKKIFFYGHDIHYHRKEQEPIASLTAKQRSSEIKKLIKLETTIWGQVDTIYYPNQNEVNEVKQFCQKNKLNCDVRLVPVFSFEKFNEEAAANLSARKDILIVAGFAHSPNQEGVIWFVKNVWPSLIKKHSDLCLNIIGSNPPQKICELADKNIRVTGWVSDAELEIYLRNCRVSVAPLLSGAGMKGKIVEALAWGLPVVTTSVGLQGLEQYDDIISTCNEPQKMIQEINILLRTDNIWIERSKKSVNLAKRLFSKKALQEALKGLY